MMYSTISNTSIQSILKVKQVLKEKLKYEWKNIYRHFSILDRDAKGFVSASEFESTICKFGAYLSKEDLSRITKLYSNFSNSGDTTRCNINYHQLSIDLGLHLNSFEFLRSQHSRQLDI